MNKFDFLTECHSVTKPFFVKKVTLSLANILGVLCFLLFSITVDAQECKVTNDCMEYTFMGKSDNGDGTSTLCIKVTNHCKRALSYMAFDVNGAAVAPGNGGSVTGIAGVSYKVENPTNNPYQGALKFETRGEGIKRGASDLFCFDLPTASTESMVSINLQAKAANMKYEANLDWWECDDVCINIPFDKGGLAGVNGIDVNYAASDATVCMNDPFIIENVMSPSGGRGDLEVVWIKCSDPSGSCTSAFNALIPLNIGQLYDEYINNGGSPQIGDSCWEFVTDNDDDDLSLVVDGISNTTCFLRCIRSEKCERFTGEGNIITVSAEQCVAPLNTDLEKNDFSVYPNPAKNWIIMDMSDYVGRDANIYIYDALGRIHFEEKHNKLENKGIYVDLQGLNNGVYTAVVKTKQDRILSSRSFVISK